LVSDPVAYTAGLAQEQLGLERRASPPMPMGHLRLAPALPTPESAWATEAAGLTFYLHPDLLLASLYDGVPAATGILILVDRERQVAGITSSMHPALLVQTASASLSVACVELVPHLSVDDPLLHHMGLVLQAAIAVEGIAGQLYAESLANALAV